MLESCPTYPRGGPFVSGRRRQLPVGELGGHGRVPVRLRGRQHRARRDPRDRRQERPGRPDHGNPSVLGASVTSPAVAYPTAGCRTGAQCTIESQQAVRVLENGEGEDLSVPRCPGFDTIWFPLLCYCRRSVPASTRIPDATSIMPRRPLPNSDRACPERLHVTGRFQLLCTSLPKFPEKVRPFHDGSASAVAVMAWMPLKVVSPRWLCPLATLRKTSRRHDERAFHSWKYRAREEDRARSRDKKVVVWKALRLSFCNRPPPSLGRVRQSAVTRVAATARRR